MNDCAFSFLSTFFAFSVGFFPILFDIGDVSNQLVSACVIVFIWASDRFYVFLKIGNLLR